MNFYRGLVFPAEHVNHAYEAAQQEWRQWGGGENGLTSMPSHTDHSISFFLHRVPTSRHVILYSHGNAEALDASQRSFLVELARQWGVSVAAYDYSGYGDSTGEATEQNCYRNIEAVYERLLNKEAYRPQDVILFGRSIGTGPTVYLGERHNTIPKMILLSPMRSVIQCVLPFSIPLLDMFPTDKRIPKIRIPTLFIHGVDDEVVPFTHGQYLYEKSPSRGMVDPIWVQGAGHNDIFVPELMAGVKAFIEKDLT